MKMKHFLGLTYFIIIGKKKTSILNLERLGRGALASLYGGSATILISS